MYIRGGCGGKNRRHSWCIRRRPCLATFPCKTGIFCVSSAGLEPAAFSVQESAENNGIIEQAQTNAEDSLRAFVISLGYEEVVFT
jgi:hypothetical protein